ncbi:MAG: hypothetical protein EB141_20315, partial [Verrucomicrobia bacterium]|nr:hypothetical protein [Verrucomicrobiota bacterium]
FVETPKHEPFHCVIQRSIWSQILHFFWHPDAPRAISVATSTPQIRQTDQLPKQSGLLDRPV